MLTKSIVLFCVTLEIYHIVSVTLNFNYLAKFYCRFCGILILKILKNFLVNLDNGNYNTYFNNSSFEILNLIIMTHYHFLNNIINLNVINNLNSHLTVF